MPDLLIKEAEIKQLDGLIAPIPTQYGLPLVNFLNAVGQRRAQEAQQLAQSKPSGGEKESSDPVAKKEKPIRAAKAQ